MSLEFGQIQDDVKYIPMSTFVTEQSIVRPTGTTTEYYVVRNQNLNSQNCYYLRLMIKGAGTYQVSLVDYGKYGEEEYQSLGEVTGAAAAWTSFEFAFVPRGETLNAIRIEGVTEETIVVYKDFFKVHNYLDRFDFTKLVKFTMTGSMPIVINKDLIEISDTESYTLDIRNKNFNVSFLGMIGVVQEGNFIISGEDDISTGNFDNYLATVTKSDSVVMHSKTVSKLSFLFDYWYEE